MPWAWRQLTDPGSDTVRTFLLWSALRAAGHRGFVLTASLYYIVAADLSAFQLVVLGTVVSVTMLVADIPAGAWSDAASRKAMLVAGQLCLAAGMLLTGLVTAFPLLVTAQVCWGVGWGCLSGADVAWLSDELDRPDRMARVLATRARWDLLGGAAGVVGFGLLGSLAGLATAIVLAGIGMALLALLVAARFSERASVPRREPAWTASWTIIRRGFRLARHDPGLRVVYTATAILNGAGMVAWLFPRQLIDRGFPATPTLWYTALEIGNFLLGAAALRGIEPRLDAVGMIPRWYARACVAGGVGLVALALAPTALVGSAGVLLVSGIAFTITRAASVIWVNQRATSDVRATMHSFLSQAESVGEIVSGFILAVLAREAGSAKTLLAAAVLVAGTGVLVALAGIRNEPALGPGAASSG